MLKRTLLMFLLLAVVPVFGQIPDTQQTDGLFNGRWWEAHPDRMVRVSYLAGLVHALSKAEPETKSYKQLVPEGLTYGELVKAIDAIYQEPLNGRIPIMSAMQIVKAKAEGGDPEAVTRVWRKAYAEVQPVSPEVTKQ